MDNNQTSHHSYIQDIETVMVREYGDQGRVTAHSSIALLQERFRQLERMKELRHEKELLRLLSASDKHGKFEQRSNCQLSLSLWTDSQTKNTQFRTPAEDGMKPWFADAPAVSTMKPLKVEISNCDVDTSLRL